MTFFQLIFVCAVLLISAPYLRVFGKRISLAVRLRRACRCHGWVLAPTHRLWFLGRTGNDRCDCHIVTKHNVFSVKLFAVPRRSSTLVFGSGGDYFIRGYLGLLGNTGIMARIPIDGRTHILPRYRFRYRFAPEWETKSHRKILLLSPVPHEIMQIPREGERRLLGAGDLISDMQLYSLSRLLGRMEVSEMHLDGTSAFSNLIL